MEPHSLPELQRTNLTNVVLMLKILVGVEDQNFDYLSVPPEENFIFALDLLYCIGTLDKYGKITNLGEKISRLPLETSFSKSIITGCDLGCSEEVIKICSLLELRLLHKEFQISKTNTTMITCFGDHLVLLTLYNAWEDSGYSDHWGKRNKLSSSNLRHVFNMRNQVKRMVGSTKRHTKCDTQIHVISILKSFTSGFYSTISRRDAAGTYSSLLNHEKMFIHASSILRFENPSWVLFGRSSSAAKEYMIEVMVTRPSWAIQFVPRFFAAAAQYKLSRRSEYDRIEPLSTGSADPNAWRLSKRRG